MQWNLRRFVDRADVTFDALGEARPLRIPLGFAEQQAAFECGLDELNRGLEDNATPATVAQALRRIEGAAAAPFRMLKTVKQSFRSAERKSWILPRRARPAAAISPHGWPTSRSSGRNANRAADGNPRMTLSQQIDHMQKLSSQAGTAAVSRVLYAKAWTKLSAATLPATDAIVHHKAYWASGRSPAEAGYLTAVLNSAAVLAKIPDLQGIGEAGTKRDFDNLVWTLPIPEYDDTDALHRDLASAAARAESIAASVPLTDPQHFVAKRRAIRDALAEDGITAEIEALVDALLPS